MDEVLCVWAYAKGTGFEAGKLYKVLTNGCLVDDYGRLRLRPEMYRHNVHYNFIKDHRVMENE